MYRPSLRIIVMVIAGITGLKVWAQDRYQRSVFHEAILSAYADQARARCGKAIAAEAAGRQSARDISMEVVIGNPHTAVAIWDIENPLWDVRYRHPHILVSGGTAARKSCAYDLVAGLVSVGEDN